MNTHTVKDLMTHEVVSVTPDTLLFHAYEIMTKNNLHGVPVVENEKNHLVGILTEYDLITNGSALHLPTFQKIISGIKIYEGNQSELQEEVSSLKKLTVKDVMNSDPLTLSEDASYEEVIAAFRDHHKVNPIPVIDENSTLVGVVSRRDVLKLFDLIKKYG